MRGTSLIRGGDHLTLIATHGCSHGHVACSGHLHPASQLGLPGGGGHLESSPMKVGSHRLLGLPQGAHSGL